MMATPCGPSAVPTGGAGVAWPAGIWILTTARTRFLAMGLPSFLLFFVTRPARSELGDLGELELDRGLAAEDVDEHLQLELVLVDLDDLAGEVGERAFLHAHRLAHLVLEAGLGAGGGPRCPWAPGRPRRRAGAAARAWRPGPRSRSRLGCCG